MKLVDFCNISIAEATTLRARVESGEALALCQFKCHCGHKWIAPEATRDDKCPKCKTHNPYYISSWFIAAPE